MRIEQVLPDSIAEHIGLVPGDRVSIWMSNRVEPVLAFLACSRGGHAVNPSLHRTHACTEIGELLRRIDAAVLLTEPGWGPDRRDGDLDAELAKLPSLRRVYTPDSFPAAGPPPAQAPETDPDRVTYLAFTSGTTGPPKCVMHSDNTLMANARDMARDWGLDSSARILTLSPLSHHIAWVAAAEWLVTQDPMLVGADNQPVEIQPNPDSGISLPVHQIMLVVNGIHLVERMKPDELAAAGVYEFAFVVQPLKLEGATGSTVAPVAIY